MNYMCIDSCSNTIELYHINAPYMKFQAHFLNSTIGSHSNKLNSSRTAFLTHTKIDEFW